MGRPRLPSAEAKLPDEGAPTPSELEWLTGDPQEGANRFWPYVPYGRNAKRVARCRQLMANYGHLIPPDRLAQLERDLEFWAR